VTDTTLSGGTVAVNDGASGNNSVSAVADTAASKSKTLNYATGSGTDSFTGGFENDTVRVSATAVDGDTLTGGSGTNTLTLTSAGSANLGGVSKFATINLAAGNSTVTVTDKTLTGPITLKDGASGDNSVSAAGDTVASAGKVLIYSAGAGPDSFTLEYEQDMAAHASETVRPGPGAIDEHLAGAGRRVARRTHAVVAARTVVDRYCPAGQRLVGHRHCAVADSQVDRGELTDPAEAEYPGAG
jgi:hypothetical protein